jgi:hypothetical protein
MCPGSIHNLHWIARRVSQLPAVDFRATQAVGSFWFMAQTCIHLPHLALQTVFLEAIDQGGLRNPQ